MCPTTTSTTTGCRLRRATARCPGLLGPIILAPGWLLAAYSLAYLCTQVRVGWALAHRHGGPTAHALCELWLSEVMPALVVRE